LIVIGITYYHNGHPAMALSRQTTTNVTWYRHGNTTHGDCLSRRL